MVRVVMTMWIRRVQGGEKVKDQDMYEAHANNEGVYSKGSQGVACRKERLVISTDEDHIVSSEIYML